MPHPTALGVLNKPTYIDHPPRLYPSTCLPPPPGPDLEMLEPINDSALFNPTQASVDWSCGEQQFILTRKVSALLKDLLTIFSSAKEDRCLDPILEDEEVAEALHNLATFLPSYVTPSQH